jgi:hypothetical protein
LDIFGEIGTVRELLMTLVHVRRDLYLYALIRINNTFYKVIKTIENFKNTQYVSETQINMHTNIFLYKTLAAAGHAIFQSSIDKDSKICSFRPATRNMKNTSKVEILTCIILSKAHRSVCNGRVYSVVDSDGTQFKPQNGCAITCDLFCTACKTAYFIQVGKNVITNRSQSMFITTNKFFFL